MNYKTIDLKNYKKSYVAPLIGNGSISFQADFEGSMQNMAEQYAIKNNSDMRIWLAGRRYMHTASKELISYGNFEQSVCKNKKRLAVKEARQAIDVKNAVMSSKCIYENNALINSRIFAHHDYNLIAINKKIVACQKFNYKFSYNLCSTDDKEKLPEFTDAVFEKSQNGYDIFYSHPTAIFKDKGIIKVFSDKSVTVKKEGNRILFEADVLTDTEISFYILFCDSVDFDDYMKKAEEIKSYVLYSSFEKEKETHSEKWRKYFEEGYAEIDNEEINNVYNTAQYHLKCNMTKWSVPVGISNGLWNGKYFAFDEFYMLMSYLTSNHMYLAYRIPKFRFNGLEKAVKRASSACDKKSAHYPWQTDEEGNEAGGVGFWYDHIFHMAAVALAQYQYYKFTNDKEFLKNVAYPVIECCARFYMDYHIYKTYDGKTIVGKCTDLERLGAAVSNAYMTTCGVIKTFYVLYEIADILNLKSEDKEFAKRCKKCADKLFASLPDDGEKYIPYDGCTDVSIGLLSGTYPFDVVPCDSVLQKNGIKNYIDSEKRVGNMYSVGSGVCSWYLTWKALVFARFMKGEDSFAALKEASENRGLFYDMYEISDDSTGTYYRPWFTTAAGMFAHALNEMLLQKRGDTIFIAPALSKNQKNFSFKLNVHGGLCVEAKVNNLVLEKLCIRKNKFCTESKIKIQIPESINCDKLLNETNFEKKGSKNNYIVTL